MQTILIPFSLDPLTYNISFLMAFYMSFHNFLCFDDSKRKEMTNNEKESRVAWQSWHHFSHRQHHHFTYVADTWDFFSFWLAANMMRKWIIFLVFFSLHEFFMFFISLFSALRLNGKILSVVKNKILKEEFSL